MLPCLLEIMEILNVLLGVDKPVLLLFAIVAVVFAYTLFTNLWAIIPHGSCNETAKRL